MRGWKKRPPNVPNLSEIDLVKAGSLLFRSNKSNSLSEQHFCLKLENLLYASVCRPEMRGARPLERANSTAPLPVAITARKIIYWSSFTLKNQYYNPSLRQTHANININKGTHSQLKESRQIMHKKSVNHPCMQRN